MSELNSKVIVLIDNNIKSIIKLKEENHLDKKIEEKFNFLIYVFRQSDNIFVKKYIIENLIKIFPKNYNLYFLMGYALKDKDVHTSLFYYKKCFEINKNYTENMIEMCRLLFILGEYKQIINIITKYYKTVTNYIHDYHIKSTLAYAYIKNKQYVNGEKILLEILDSKNCNKIDIDMMLGIFNNISHMYGDLNNYEKSVLYLNKAIDLIIKDIEKEKKNIYIYSNLLVYNDYFVDIDIQKNKKIYDRLNYLYETEKYNNKEKIKEEKEEKEEIKKIKLGYVSSDFVNHAVSNFILPIINNHNLDEYEIWLFNNSDKHNNKNDIKEVVKNGIKIINIFNLKTDEVCDIIKEEKIDILFDLNGHTDGNRLDVFAKKPSNIQISYIGYPNTTGLKTIDYRIVDKITDKNTKQENYSEKLLFLKNCFLLYNSYQQFFPVNTIDNGEEIILGSMNRENKNSKNVLNVWKNILKKCNKQVKLLIKINGSDKDTIEERRKFYKDILEIKDNEDDKLILVSSSMSTSEYFNTFGRIDILLDTFPYSGTTTSCNALFNSVPIVTLYKDNCHCQNVTSSLLINSGLEELVAYSEKEYINKVVDLCNDKTKIYEYKNKVHLQFKNGVMNQEKFIKEYENTIKSLL